MRSMSVPSFLSAAAAVVALVAPSVPALAADDAPPAQFGVRVYELFELGPELRLEARTSKTFRPNPPRLLPAGAVFPAEGQPALRVAKVRGHRAFLGSCWREDGTPDGGVHGVLVIEESSEPGVAHVRVKVVPLAEASRASNDPSARASMGVTDVPADKATAPLWGVRFYEVFQRDGDLVLGERTMRAFGLRNIRNLPFQALHPASDAVGFEVWRSRDSLGFWGATWREDAVSDGDANTVAVFDEGGLEGTAMTRVRVAVVPAKETPPAPRRQRFPDQAPASAAPTGS